MTKAKTGWTTCPICRARLKAEKLEGHLKTVHPKGTNVPGARGRVHRRKRTAANAGKAAVMGAVIIAIILLSYFIYTHMPAQGAKVGEKPLAFTLPDQNGQDYALYDHLGTEPLLMAFMSSTCSYCAETADVIHNLYQNYSGQIGFVVLISNTDATAYDVSYFHNTHHLQFPTLYDAHGSVYHRYRAEPRYFPTIYLIDKNGRIHWIDEGEQSYEDLEGTISEVL